MQIHRIESRVGTLVVSNHGGSRSVHFRNNVGYCHSLPETFGTASFDCDCPSAACDSSLLHRYVSPIITYNVAL